MSKIFGFGETVNGYTIPVLNEREIRAAAGMLFVVLLISVMLAGQGNFVLLKYFILIFLADFLMRLFINPKYAPTLIMARWIVRKQVPEYVGAAQKKFAWWIGLILASLMFVLVVVMNTFSPISGLSCFICLIFLFFESAFGICLGCLFYRWFKKDQAQYCPGEVCEIKDRHDIQKMNWGHGLIALAFVGFIVLSIMLFNETFSKDAVDLFDLMSKN